MPYLIAYLAHTAVQMPRFGTKEALRVSLGTGFAVVGSLERFLAVTTEEGTHFTGALPSLLDAGYYDPVIELNVFVPVQSGPFARADHR